MPNPLDLATSLVPVNPSVPAPDFKSGATPALVKLRVQGPGWRGSSCALIRRKISSAGRVADLGQRPELFAWSSASLGMDLDPPPPGLKPSI
jgi:hypothetical protein